jgi:hypothetical protein
MRGRQHLTSTSMHIANILLSSTTLSRSPNIFTILKYTSKYYLEVALPLLLISEKGCGYQLDNKPPTR